MKILRSPAYSMPSTKSKVSQKYLKEFLELLPVQDLNNQGRKLQNGVRKSFLNVICLLNVIYILVKYHENILTCFKVMVCTKFLQKNS